MVERRRGWLRRRALLAVVAVGALVAGATSETAQPAFPGKNGLLAVQFGAVTTAVPGCISSSGCSQVAVLDPSADALGVAELMGAVSGLGQRAEPAWSPNGTRYAFSKLSGYGLYVAKADGTITKTLFELAGGPSSDQPYLFRSPSWSPNGRQIAYVREGRPGPGGGARRDQIRVVTPSGTGDKLIWESSSNASEYVWIDEVAWSPDGRRLAVTIEEQDVQTDSFDLFVIGVDGTVHKRLTSTTADEYAPDWSPDGRRIAFVRGPLNDSEIHAVNADGSKPLALTDNDARDEDPAWSPDGGKIAFVSDRDRSGATSGFDAYVMNANGSGVERLTIGGRGAPNVLNTFVRNPSWRPIDVKPSVSRVTATPPPKPLAPTKASGVTVTFRLSEIATVELVLTSTTDTDVKRTHRVDGKAGLNSVTLGSSVIRGLTPGRYVVTVTARDLLGNRSQPVSAPVTLAKT